MNKLFVLFIFLALVACNQLGEKIVQHTLNPDNVPSAFVEIDPSKDTTVTLPGGTQLIIPQGAIKSSKNRVKLEVKEVLTPRQIVAAGMLTLSDGRMLSSGGMLYVNAARGEDATIIKPLTAKIPTVTANPKMQVFTGDTANGTINWKDPQPLGVQKNKVFEQGKQLFLQNCASCHDPAKHATGPALYGSQQRWDSKEKCYAFIRNCAEMIASGDPYANCLFDTWNKTAMTAFPTLSDAQLDAMFRYVDEEARERLGADTVRARGKTWKECQLQKKMLEQMQQLQQKQAKLQTERKVFVSVKTDTRPVATGIAGSVNIDVPDLVVPDIQQADYYSIEIKGFGWYNVDILADTLGGYEQSKLRVHLQGSKSDKLRVLLFIPSERIMNEGGLLNDGNAYGFYNKDGSIVLPQGKTAYILAMSEEREREQLYFGSAAFVMQKEQDITVTLQPVTRDGMLQAIDNLKLNDVSVSIQKDTAAIQVHDLQRQIDSLENIVSHECYCMMGYQAVESAGGDSATVIYH